jgi:hypothetical protein
VKGVVEVHAGKHRKHIGLKEGHEELQRRHGNGHQQRQNCAADTDNAKTGERDDEAGETLSA